DESYSERTYITSSDGILQKVSEDRRQDWKKLDGPSGGYFLLFHRNPQDPTPFDMEEGDFRSCDKADQPSGLSTYRISIPMTNRTHKPYEDSRTGRDIEETYSLVPGKTYHLWGRIQGWK